MECLLPSRRRWKPFASRYFTSSPRLTDKLCLYKYLLQEVSPERDFFALLPVCFHHLLQGIPEYLSAVLDGFTLGNHLRPLNKLSHVAGAYFGILRGIASHHRSEEHTSELQ